MKTEIFAIIRSTDRNIVWAGVTTREAAELTAIKLGAANVSGGVTLLSGADLAAFIIERAEPPEVKTWTITIDEDGRFHTTCPHCGAEDQIFEHDTAVRWNLLDITDDTSAVAYIGPGDFDGDGWICGSCLSTDLEAPTGFEITDWV